MTRSMSCKAHYGHLTWIVELGEIEDGPVRPSNPRAPSHLTQFSVRIDVTQSDRSGPRRSQHMSITGHQWLSNLHRAGQRLCSLQSAFQLPGKFEDPATRQCAKQPRRLWSPAATRSPAETRRAETDSGRRIPPVTQRPRPCHRRCHRPPHSARHGTARSGGLQSPAQRGA